MKMVKLSKL